VGAGYLTITNKGAVPDRLIGGSTDAARAVEVHEMNLSDGVMTMRPLRDGLVIEPGKSVTLAPVGFHSMFVYLKSSLKLASFEPRSSSRKQARWM
jgi:copper(I)-binding protein